MLQRPRNICLGMVVAAILALVWAPGAGAWKPGPVRYGVLAERNVAVPMSDGVTLKADVYRPSDRESGRRASGRFPVIVTLTPYRKAADLPPAVGPLRDLIRRGYMHAIVDVRGTGTSGGRFGFFDEREQRDGAEVVDWAAGLSGSSGKVGMYGGSYLGITQLNTAARVGRDSPLRAIMPIVATHDVYRDFGAPGGMFAGAFDLVWFAGLRPLLDTVIPPEDIADDPEHALVSWLQRTGNITGTDLPVIADGLLGGETRYDGPFYRLRSPGRRLDRIVRNRVPTLLIGGHSDVFQRGEPLNYAGLQNATAGRRTDRPMRAGQPISPRYQLVQGPWFHGEAVFVPELPELALRWFDTWLKGKDTAMRRERSPLHLFELGSNRWVDTARWPLKGTRMKTFYLGEGRTGTAASRNDGLLAPKRPTQGAGEDALPFSPVPELCSRLAEQYAAGGASAVDPCVRDDRPQQPTALTYTTDPFKRRTSIAGPIAATLYARSNRPETSTILTLEDVAPDGRSLPLTGGQLLGSFRANRERRSWRIDGRLVMPYHPFTKRSRRSMATGRVERLDVEVLPVLAGLAPGHRLRLTITTNLAPVLVTPPAEYFDLGGGTTRYQRSAAHPSRINIPLIRSDRLRTSGVDWGSCDASC